MNYSIIVCSPKGSTRTIQLSQAWAVASVVVCSLLGLVLVVSIAINVGVFVQFDTKSNQQYVHDQQSIELLQSDINALRNMVEQLLQKEEAIRQDLGHPKYRKLSKRRLIKQRVNRFNEMYPSNPSSIHQFGHELSYIKEAVLRMEQTMRNHYKVLNQYLTWFNSTPSIWPVYGYIRSGFGWRIHPIRGRRQFHNGIDVPAWLGAPVQATADGYVEYSGWSGGYGWTIVLSHDFGYQTLYAHLSELDIPSGSWVKKGQIIGKIGSSGLSTGPHVHYEIRQRGRPLEPTTYLDLDLFTAVSKLW